MLFSRNVNCQHFFLATVLRVDSGLKGETGEGAEMKQETRGMQVMCCPKEEREIEKSAISVYEEI